MSRGLDATPLTPAQQRLVLDNQAFVQKAVRYYGHRFRQTLSADDVRQLVLLALTEAARSFDPTHGISFPTFAWRGVAGAIFDAAREESAERALLRQAVAAAADLELTDVDLDADTAADQARADAGAARLATAGVIAITASPRPSARIEPASPTRTPEDEILVAELRTTLAAALVKLPERSRRVVSLYYGENRTLREVSTELEVSYATVRRDHEEALDALREGCRRAGVEPPT